MTIARRRTSRYPSSSIAIAALAAGVLIASASAAATPITFTLDPTQSTLDTTVTAQGLTDSDSSPLSGTIEIDLDDPIAPTAASLIDFTIAADEDLNYLLDGAFLGSITASVTGLVTSYAGAAPLGPVAVTPAGDAAFLNVPVQNAGTGDYTATGFLCSFLTGSGLPCVDTFGLANDGPQSVPQIDGSLSLADAQTLRLDLAWSLTVPLDPANPDIGDLDLNVVGVAFADLPAAPCPGDADGDNAVDGADLLAVINNFGSATNAGPAGGDLDNSGSVDGGDLLAVINNFGVACN